MSMKTWIVYGHGFEIDKVELSSIVDFIKNHKKSFCKNDVDTDVYNKLLENVTGMEDIYDLDDFIRDEFYCCKTSGQEGVGAIISNIMMEETGIRFEFQQGCDDCGTEPAVIFSDCPVWCYNEAEKHLTEDSFLEICDKYIEELGLYLRAEYLELEYYG